MKDYTLHFVEPFAAEKLPEFAKGIHELSDSPPKWDARSFATFRAQLERVLVSSGVPELFRQGLIDYHLSLFHEGMDESSYKDRLESAFGALRWFIPYSDIARLICGFYLFRANEFTAALKFNEGLYPELDSLAGFFTEKTARSPQNRRPKSSTRKGIPLLVPEAEMCAAEAIHSIARNDPMEALRQIGTVRQTCFPNLHRERFARLDLIEARAHFASGDLDRGRAIAERLIESPWRGIADAANRVVAECTCK